MIIQGTLDENGDFVQPAKPIVFKDDGTGGGGGGWHGGEVEVTNFPATQPVSGSVSVSNFPATQPVSGSVTATGPITNAQMTAIMGTAAQTAVTTDPELAGQTMLALLRGILAEMQTQTALLNDIKTNTLPE